MPIFCPRCGSQNPETTKFCRQCGLSLQQLSGYIASGGTGALTPQPPSAPPMVPPPAGISPQQKMFLGIVMSVLSPAICGVLGKLTGLSLFRGLAGLCAVMIPVMVLWIVFHFRAQMRAQKQIEPPQPPAPPTQRPAFQNQPYQAPLPAAPPTNPLGAAPGSITEDETRHLPDRS